MLSVLVSLVLAIGAPASLRAQVQAAPAVNADLLVSTGWLAERLGDPDVVVLQVGRNPDGYQAGHIPGARFLTLGSIVVEEDGVLNQLPPVDRLREAFEQAGVSDRSHVVLYGDLDGLSAARTFFTLDYLGHERISLLDGGIEAWRAENRALSQEAPRDVRGTLTPRPQPDRVVTAEWVRERLDDPRFVLIDARPAAQFTGEEAGGGIDRPGHIPGSRNIFWKQALVSDTDLRLRSPAELRALFTNAGAAPDRTVVTYCRTGVQASHAYFVSRYLGYDTKLYDGSFIDWSRRADAPVSR